jgi:exopolyphosphatase/guanosine-5'-triphosphate,3'-diphosphate pyrophosphatase
MPSAALAEMEGVSASRAHQLLAGAVVAETAMRRLGIDAVDMCPWALREGVILRRLDVLESV